jgi:hypothetical protein
MLRDMLAHSPTITMGAHVRMLVARRRHVAMMNDRHVHLDCHRQAWRCTDRDRREGEQRENESTNTRPTSP